MSRQYAPADSTIEQRTHRQQTEPDTRPGDLECYSEAPALPLPRWVPPRYEAHHCIIWLLDCLGVAVRSLRCVWLSPTASDLGEQENRLVVAREISAPPRASFLPASGSNTHAETNGHSKSSMQHLPSAIRDREISSRRDLVTISARTFEEVASINAGNVVINADEHQGQNMTI